MYHLLPTRKLIGILAFIHIGLTGLVALVFNPGGTPFEAIEYSNYVILSLGFTLTILSTTGWRWLWRRIPLLAERYFPDLNGVWEGKIMFQTGSKTESLETKLRIRQNLWSIHIDLCNETSKSRTLVAHPNIESGNKTLYYIFHNTPRNPNHAEYKGTSVLSVSTLSTPARLSGHYFTARGTTGTMEVSQISTNPDTPYEFY